MKRYINVAYEDRDLAKRLGARWDASVKRWYYPKGSKLERVLDWRSSSSRRLQSQFGSIKTEKSSLPAAQQSVSSRPYEHISHDNGHAPSSIMPLKSHSAQFSLGF